MCWVCFPDGAQDRKAVCTHGAMPLPPELNFYYFISRCKDFDSQNKLRGKGLIATFFCFFDVTGTASIVLS